MKKNEKWILAIVAIAMLLLIGYFKMPKNKQSVKVAVQRGNTIVLEFDPSEDAIYHVPGDYGSLDIEVKDGKWHVTNEVCPNHICHKLGWVDENDPLPITCMPNNIIIYVEEQ